MEPATSPLITNTLWTLSTAAFVLGIYVQSYQTRLVIFCALSSIIYYQLVHTSTGDPPNVSSHSYPTPASESFSRSLPHYANIST